MTPQKEVAITKTFLHHLSGVPASSALPSSVPNPIKPELFHGKHEAQLGKQVGLTQFGVNHLTLEPRAGR